MSPSGRRTTWTVVHLLLAPIACTFGMVAVMSVVKDWVEPPRDRTTWTIGLVLVVAAVMVLGAWLGSHSALTRPASAALVVAASLTEYQILLFLIDGLDRKVDDLLEWWPLGMVIVLYAVALLARAGHRWIGLAVGIVGLAAVLDAAVITRLLPLYSESDLNIDHAVWWFPSALLRIRFGGIGPVEDFVLSDVLEVFPAMSMILGCYAVSYVAALWRATSRPDADGVLHDRQTRGAQLGREDRVAHG